MELGMAFLTSCASASGEANGIRHLQRCIELLSCLDRKTTVEYLRVGGGRFYRLYFGVVPLFNRPCFDEDELMTMCDLVNTEMVILNGLGTTEVGVSLSYQSTVPGAVRLTVAASKVRLPRTVTALRAFDVATAESGREILSRFAINLVDRISPGYKARLESTKAKIHRSSRARET